MLMLLLPACVPAARWLVLASSGHAQQLLQHLQLMAMTASTAVPGLSAAYTDLATGAGGWTLLNVQTIRSYYQFLTAGNSSRAGGNAGSSGAISMMADGGSSSAAAGDQASGPEGGRESGHDVVVGDLGGPSVVVAASYQRRMLFGHLGPAAGHQLATEDHASMAAPASSSGASSSSAPAGGPRRQLLQGQASTQQAAAGSGGSASQDLGLTVGVVLALMAGLALLHLGE